MQGHATVMGPENLLVSADWVGAMRRLLEEADGGLTLYLQGATGDLNPKLNVENDFENTKKIGQEAFEAIVEILTRMQALQACLLYTSDAADDLICVDLGGRRIIKKTIHL